MTVRDLGGDFARRETMGGGLAAFALMAMGTPAFGKEGKGIMSDQKAAYGLVGQIKAQPGKRDALLAILAEGTGAMPGNIAYIIGADVADADSIWITELWTSKDAHAASLELPAVQAAIMKARPVIAGFGTRAEFVPA